MLRNTRALVRGLSVALLLLVGAVGILTAQDGNGKVDAGRLKDPSYLREVLDESPESVVLVDVRAPREFGSGHIPGAISISHTEIANNAPTEDKDATIVLHRRSDNRSSQADRVLRSMGYSQLINFGGITSWPYDLAY